MQSRREGYSINNFLEEDALIEQDIQEQQLHDQYEEELNQKELQAYEDTEESCDEESDERESYFAAVDAEALAESKIIRQEYEKSFQPVQATVAEENDESIEDPCIAAYKSAKGLKLFDYNRAEPGSQHQEKHASQHGKEYRSYRR